MAKRQKRTPNPLPQARGPLPRVLVVEDDVDAREAISALLEGGGYEVDRAVDAQDALLLAASRPPHLVTLDVHMPVLNGYELARRLQNEVRLDAPLVAITGKTPPLLPGPFDEVLFKPVDEEVLLEVVARLLKVRRKGG